MWNLEKISVNLGENEFLAFKDTNTNQHYFGERIPVYGILDFGFLQASATATISLANNGITVPVILDSLAVTAPGTTGDEVTVDLIRDRAIIATQVFKNDEMPFSHPTIVLTPDLTVRVQPRYDCAVYMYVKPVHILFRATPSQANQ